MATIAACHDLSGVGRCSLTAAISILSAMGHHCCPLPTAVLSNQTGFPRYTYLDFTPEIPGYLEAWNSLNLEPDLIYTGFLGGEEQPALLAEYALGKPCTLVVDPVLGDNGGLYPCYGPQYGEQMRGLAEAAHVITPNTTELLLLSRRDPGRWDSLDEGDCLECLRDLQAPRLQWAVITGFVQGDRVRNLLVEPASGRTIPVENHYTGISYSGTGDIFTSVLCGWIARGASPLEAVERAGEFVARAVETMDPGEDPRHGIRYEQQLYRLAQRPD